MDGEYHPAFGSPPEHDHHRRARRFLLTGMALLLGGVVLLYWAAEDFWGNSQTEIGRAAGWVGLGSGAFCLVVGSIAWFALDDDEHPDED